MRAKPIRDAYIALLCLAAAAAPTSAQITEPDLTWSNGAALEAGEVELHMNKEGRITEVTATILVDAPPQDIWDVLVACEIAPEYVPNVVACRSIELVDDGAGELFIQTIKPAFFIPSFEHVFRMDYQPFQRIDINRVSGPIKLLESVWWLKPRGDGRVSLIYTLRLDPGIPIPRMFVRTTLRRDLPRVLLAVRERAEAAAQAR
jgi:ribosome-associated toxin RatA of RatAB toxin-antitoxin module